jgi:hypothetical protein
MKLILCLAAVASIAASCGPAGAELVETSWDVVSVGGAEIAPEDRANVTFHGDRVDIDTPCGSMTTELNMDTDGPALSLLSDSDVAEACGGNANSRVRDQLDALRHVVSWRRETNDRIILEGGDQVALLKLSN